MSQTTIRGSRISTMLFADTNFSWLWFLIRLYLGYEWLIAGWGKFQNPAWVGDQTGMAVKGFLTGALGKMSGAHPDVSSWYGAFIQNFALPNAEIFSYVVTFGEMAVGLALILGFLTGVSAFFGVLMNYNFMLAGSVSVNPIMALLGVLLILAWRTAGWYGLDRYILPKIFRKNPIGFR